MRRTTTALLALVLASGCAGPQAPLEVGFREVPSDVVLGSSASPAPPGTAGPTRAPALPPPPGVVALPPPVFDAALPAPPPSPVTVPEPVACAAADPLEAPAVEAPNSIATPPRPATYVFRNDGTFAVSGADARAGRFPDTSLRHVGGVNLVAAEEFTYDVAEVLGDVTTTTTYRVVRSSSVPTAAGLFVQRVRSTRPGGGESVFEPVPELRLASLPLVRGATHEVRGVDPENATAMQFRSTVTGKARVDACGRPLDSWTVRLTEGRLLAPEQDLEFEATLSIGTQYGGLVLREALTFAGTDRGAGVSRSNTATISTEPGRR